MNEMENTGWTSLPPEKVRAIDRIEPPEHNPGFWDRLEQAVDEGAEAGPDLLDRRPLLVDRAAALTAVAAVLLLFAVITLRPKEASQEVDSISDPAQTDGDPVVPDDPRPEVLAIPDPGIDSGTPSTIEGGQRSTTVPREADPPPAPTAAPQDPSPSTTDSSPAPTDPPVAPSSTPPTTNQDPVRLEAESMETRTTGDFEADGWSLWSAGHVEDRVNLPAGGTYRLTVRAEGRSKTTTKPEMAVRVDGVPVGATTVEVDDFRLYRFTVQVDAGTHRIRVAFTNDPNTPDDDVDLIIDYVELAPIG